MKKKIFWSSGAVTANLEEFALAAASTLIRKKLPILQKGKIARSNNRFRRDPPHRQ